MKKKLNQRNIYRHNYDSDLPAGDNDDVPFIQAIWSHQIKATPARIRILAALSKEPLPISADDIITVLNDKSDSQTISRTVNKATIYRTLLILTRIGLVNKTEIGGTEARYEISFGRSHHHHATCTSCGLIEDVNMRDDQEFNAVALHSSRGFKSIQNHSLEFFGTCKKCDHNNAYHSKS